MIHDEYWWFFKVIYPLVPSLLIALGAAVIVAACRRKISRLWLAGGVFAALVAVAVFAAYVVSFR